MFVFLNRLIFRSGCLIPPSLPLPGELQPMASSASVASLVIAVETGLSDEEGSIEQSQLGDKSWEEPQQNQTRTRAGKQTLNRQSWTWARFWFGLLFCFCCFVFFGPVIQNFVKPNQLVRSGPKLNKGLYWFLITFQTDWPASASFLVSFWSYRGWIQDRTWTNTGAIQCVYLGLTLTSPRFNKG